MIPEEIELADRIAEAELIADRRGSRVWKVRLAEAELIADRRGSRVWKVRLAGDGVVAVKYTVDEARGVAAREAAVLRHIDREGYLRRTLEA